MRTKGFTLIELLVVIAIVAVLSVVVILTLNPAELLKQARDANRISDLNTVKNAVLLYLQGTSTPSLAPNFSTCYMTVTSSSRCGNTFNTNYTSASSVSLIAVDGTGWVPVNFTSLTISSPLSALPRDPINNATYFYAYGASSTVFKLVANMESLKFSEGGSNDVESNTRDGGSVTTHYEVGSDLTL